MKVYMLTEWMPKDIGGYSVVGIFSSEEFADQAMKKCIEEPSAISKDTNECACEYVIEELRVNYFSTASNGWYTPTINGVILDK